MGLGITLAEKGWLPDSWIRLGIRSELRDRLRSIERDTEAERVEMLAALIEEMDRSPIAVATETANRQHYEVPAEFFELVLGRHLKYSCCLWPAGTPDLDGAERAMLERTCSNAGLEDGMRVLELGCGWGSLSLWIAATYPASEILAVSNSASQKAFIDETARSRGLTNLTVSTADMNVFEPGARFDRVVSVEMFEHMRNYRRLLDRIRGWLTPEGRLFVHVFCHRRWPYFFEAHDEGDWMAEHFFTAGLMPSDDLFERLDSSAFVLDRQWSFSGEHFERTSEAWLARMDANLEAIRSIFAKVYGEDAELWVQRWRIFFMACAELFGTHRGQEWWVSHYLLRPLRAAS